MKNLPFLFIAAVLFSCNTAPQSSVCPPPATDRVITKPEQDGLTPDSVIAMLKSGNERFYTIKNIPQNDTIRIRLSAKGQYPMAAILSCLDSRVPVERVFDKGIGDLFVARVAGNISNEDILGSLEFACRVMGAKAIIVLGHEDCGAIKGAISNVEMGNITALLAKIKPAVAATQYTGDRTAENPEFVHKVAMKNIELTIQNIRAKSDTLNKMEKAGQIKIIGGMYDLNSGKITFIKN